MADYIVRQVDLKSSPDSSSLSQKITLYRGDRGVCLKFAFTDSSQYIFSSVENLKVKVSIIKPSGEYFLFEDTDIKDTFIELYVNEEFCNEITEIGTYKLQLHIIDGDSRVSYAPFTFEVKDSFLIEDGDAVAGYAITDDSNVTMTITEKNEVIITSADIRDGYTATKWAKGDIISSNALNKIELNLEDAISVINDLSGRLESVENVKSIELKGVIVSEEELPEEAEDNDAYMIEDTKVVHVRKGDQWINVGELSVLEGPMGPKGVQGNTGEKGEKGEPGTTDYNELINKPEIPSIEGLASEEYVNTQIANIPPIDLSPYATKEQMIIDLGTKAEKDHEHTQYLTEHQSLEHLALKEHTHDEYLTEHQSLEHLALKEHTHDEYLTEHQSLEHLALKEHTHEQYLTSHQSLDHLALKEHTHEQYLTEHQSLEHLALKSELHSHSNKDILDTITQEMIDKWNQPQVDLSGYALKSELHSHTNKGLLDIINQEKIDKWNSVDSCVTKKYADATYALKSDLSNMINGVIGETTYKTLESLEDKINTEVTNITLQLNTKATKSDITTEINKIKGDNVISDYDTLSEIGYGIQSLNTSVDGLNTNTQSLDTRVSTLQGTVDNNVTNITKLENDVASINRTITTLNNEKIKSTTIKGIEIVDSLDDLPSEQEEGVLYIVNGEIL